MSVRSERAAEAVAGVKLRVDAKLGDIWWTILSRGVLTLGLAVCPSYGPSKPLQSSSSYSARTF